MANLATTTYKVTGTQEAVSDLWNKLQEMEVNSKNVWLGDLAKSYGIDFEEKRISVRGHIYWAEYEEDKENEIFLLSFETETAWDACNEIFFEINRILNDELSISYRCCECGCEVFYTHDESNYFPEECCVNSNGAPFEDALEEMYYSVEDAIQEWCTKMGQDRGNKTEEEMVKYINGYEYEEDETYFYIYTFTFE